MLWQMGLKLRYILILRAERFGDSTKDCRWEETYMRHGWRKNYEADEWIRKNTFLFIVYIESMDRIRQNLFISVCLKVRNMGETSWQAIDCRDFVNKKTILVHDNQSMIIIIISQIINKKKHLDKKQKKAMNRARFSSIYSFVRCFINGQFC